MNFSVFFRMRVVLVWGLFILFLLGVRPVLTVAEATENSTYRVVHNTNKTGFTRVRKVLPVHKKLIQLNYDRVILRSSDLQSGLFSQQVVEGVFQSPIGPDGQAVEDFSNFCPQDQEPGFYTDDVYGDVYCDDLARANFFDEELGYFIFDDTRDGLAVYFDEEIGEFYFDETGEVIYIDEVGTYYLDQEDRAIYFDDFGEFYFDEEGNAVELPSISDVEPVAVTPVPAVSVTVAPTTADPVQAVIPKALPAKKAASPTGSTMSATLPVQAVGLETTGIGISVEEFGQFYADRKMAVVIRKLEQTPIPIASEDPLSFRVTLGYVLTLELENLGERPVDRVELVVQYTRSDRTVMSEHLTLSLLDLQAQGSKIITLTSVGKHIHPPSDTTRLSVVVDRAF